MSLINKLAKKTEDDVYFKKIYNKLEEMYFRKTLCNDSIITNLTNKEYYDLLRYADILCRSNESSHRQKSHRIISLMNEFYNSNTDFQLYAEAILIKLGNFPAKKIINKDNKLYVNTEIELDKLMKEVYQKTPDDKYVFTDVQYELFEKIKNSNHYSFSGPTSFGKSFIIEEFIKYIINERKGIDNIAILVPTRALIHQVREQLKNVVKDNKNYKIIEYPDIPSIYENKKYIFIYTPERLISYLGKNDVPNIDYMFIDEAQKIISNKDTRSPLYYHAILLAQRKSIKLYFASPNIPNADIFLKIFEKSQLENMVIHESPVTQSKFYIDLLENKCFAINDEEKIVEIQSNIINNDESIGNNRLNNIIKKVGSGSQNIIYCNSTNDTISNATSFSKNIEYKENEELNKLIKIVKENIHDEYYLIDCLRKGVAFHFGKLPQRIREKIEELFQNGVIDYLFCTSTLLEGVNLPAKNIFILSNSISRSKFSDIDFRNLAGRAGRLKHELIGNVICIRHSKKNNTWKGIEIDKEIIQNTKLKDITYDLIDGKRNFYKNIGRAIQNKDFTTQNASEGQKNIWKNYSNLVIMHASENNSSMLIKEFYEKNNDAKKIIAEAQKENKVPSYILEQSPEIRPQYQNNILKRENDYKFPEIVSKRACREVLNCLYDNYNWKEEESKGDNPLARNEKRIVYLKHLMYNWITSRPLKVIISLTIKYYSKKKRIFKNGKMEYFDKNNRDQINQVINDVMGGIDTDLRFKIKNYMTNYYLLMCEKYGKDNAGADWTDYVEYGTTNRKIIEIQKLGISISTAEFLLSNINKGIEFKDNILTNIDKDLILSQIDHNNNFEEYSEIENKL